MIDVFEIDSVADVATFAVWTLAVCALAKAAFGSFAAAEIGHRVALRDAPRRNRIGRLQWEIQNRAVWTAEAQRNSPNAATQPLSDEDVNRRAAELRGLVKTSLANRAATYFLNCWACQTFWVAVVVYAIANGVGDVMGLVFSAAAYSGGAVALYTLLHAGPSAPSGGRGSCPSCGHAK